jgi:hypothetical protein
MFRKSHPYRFAKVFQKGYEVFQKDIESRGGELSAVTL